MVNVVEAGEELSPDASRTVTSMVYRVADVRTGTVQLVEASVVKAAGHVTLPALLSRTSVYWTC